MPRAALVVAAAFILTVSACGRASIPSLPGAEAPVAAAAAPAPRAADPGRDERAAPAPRRAAPPTLAGVYRMGPIVTWDEYAVSQPIALSVRSLQDPSLVRCRLEQGPQGDASRDGQALFSYPLEAWRGISPLARRFVEGPPDPRRSIALVGEPGFASHAVRAVAVTPPIGACGPGLSAFFRIDFFGSPAFLVHHR